MLKTNIENPTPATDFRRWWWPGQWLSIVYGVWLDQLWYWRHVRPSLEKRWWLILPQAILGSALVALGLALAWGGLFSLLGRPVDWDLTARLTLTGAPSGFLLALAMSTLDLTLGQKKTANEGRIEKRAARLVPFVVPFISISGFTPLILQFSGLVGGWENPWQPLVFLVVLLSLVGAAMGVGLVVGHGSVPKWLYLVIAVCAVAVSIIQLRNPTGTTMPPLSMVAYIFFTCAWLSLTLFLTERWAIRQLPDRAERELLIGPAQ